jgi:mannose-6-phosphate isomerase-like protein (cupin superfamily)
VNAIRWADIPDEFVRPGVRRRGFGSTQCLLVMNECTPGMDVRPHVHDDFDQIAMIVAGNAIYHVGDVANEMGPGSIVLIPAGTWHSIEPVGDEVVQNIDVFAPCREDLAHLLEWMGDGAPPSGTAEPPDRG